MAVYRQFLFLHYAMEYISACVECGLQREAQTELVHIRGVHSNPQLQGVGYICISTY